MTQGRAYLASANETYDGPTERAFDDITHIVADDVDEAVVVVLAGGRHELDILGLRVPL